MKHGEYFPLHVHIIIEEAIEQSQSVDWLDLINCLVGLLAFLGGAWCFVQIRSLRQKQLDSTFSFLLRFAIRLKLLTSALEDYSDYILLPLCNPIKRKEYMREDDNVYHHTLVSSFLKNTQETLTFLLSSDNQIPIKDGWIEKYNTFIEFLDIYVKTEDKNFYKWTDEYDEAKEDFLNVHINNMKAMVIEIENRQKELEKILTKKKRFKK